MDEKGSIWTYWSFVLFGRWPTKKNQCSKFFQKRIIYSSLLFRGNIENIPNLFTRETNQTDCKAWISNKSTCHTCYQIHGFTDPIIKQYLYILAPNLGWPKIWAKKCTLCFYARIVIPTQAVWVSCKAFLCAFYALLLNLFMVTFPAWCSLLFLSISF